MPLPEYVPALDDPVQPHFELVSTLQPFADSDVVQAADAQGGVVAVLSKRGRLTVSVDDAEETPLAGSLPNPHGVFVHPSGRHVLVTATDGDVHYFSTRGKRTTGNVSLKTAGAHFSSTPVGNAVCWLPHASAPGDEETLAALVGTCSNGYLLEIQLTVAPANKFKASARLLTQLSLPRAQTPIRSVCAERVGEQHVLLASTATQLFRWWAPCASVGAVRDMLLHAGRVGSSSVKEVDGDADADAGQLRVYRPQPGQAPQSYAWASAAGVVHGLFWRGVGAEEMEEDEKALLMPAAPDDDTVWTNEQLLCFAAAGVASGDEGTTAPAPPCVPPTQVALTPFYMVLLYPQRCVVLHHPAGLSWRTSGESHADGDRTRQQLEERISFDPFGGPQRRAPQLVGVLRDATTHKVYVVDREQVWELQIFHEYHQQCRVFLERAINESEPLLLRKRFYDAASHVALRHPPSQRHLCEYLKGMFFLKIGAVRKAVAVLATCDHCERVLEALPSGTVRGLYLRERYDYLLSRRTDEKQDSVALACLVTWVVDAALREKRGAGDADRVAVGETQLQEFLLQSTEQCPSLWKQACFFEFLYKLLREQGYAGAAFQLAQRLAYHRHVVRQLVAEGAYAAAVDVLAKQCHSQPELADLWYEAVPALHPQLPIATTTGILRAMVHDLHAGRPAMLDAELLLPTLLKYTVAQNEVEGNSEHQAVVLLEQFIFRFQCASTAVHNYFVLLLAELGDHERLVDVLTVSLFYDVGYAFRVCLAHKCTEATIVLYRRQHLYEEAVHALLAAHDTDETAMWMAISEAEELLRGLSDRVDADRLRALWLMVVDYALACGTDQMALQVVSHSNQVLRVEDGVELHRK
ncbi:hypothetical protein STCU_08569 [Strigomonas culicis]|uniref:Pep3/Vps18 beta-propeller domain-containing protein n=1 Tax=Strigomonas culicis TaxID=28005 RepID=S9TSL3_9TRYP|nr:hypothetical protein STCU_08569 [Strigomonas culicis]|eukprot:EPY21387.1 hypothetical protein STCU_08569 [Strigomonas culicis]